MIIKLLVRNAILRTNKVKKLGICVYVSEQPKTNKTTPVPCIHRGYLKQDADRYLIVEVLDFGRVLTPKQI